MGGRDSSCHQRLNQDPPGAAGPATRSQGDNKVHPLDPACGGPPGPDCSSSDPRSTPRHSPPPLVATGTRNPISSFSPHAHPPRGQVQPQAVRTRAPGPQGGWSPHLTGRTLRPSPQTTPYRGLMGDPWGASTPISATGPLGAARHTGLGQPEPQGAGGSLPKELEQRSCELQPQRPARRPQAPGGPSPQEGFALLSTRTSDRGVQRRH